MKITGLIFFVLFLSTNCFSQKEITLEEIWEGTFRAEYLDEIKPMKDPEFYTVFGFNRQTRETTIEKRSYTDKNFSEIIISSSLLPIQYFENYEFSENENFILVSAQKQKRYRYTYSALFFIYNRTTKKLVQIFDKPIFNPKLSPNNKEVAFVFENNVYIQNLETEKVTQLTKDGQKNKIINGLADWVYEEEFGLVSAYDWNADGSKIGYLKFDEANVKEYNMEVYKNGNYPELDTFKYPKAGEENSQVSLQIINLNTLETQKSDLSKFESYYIPYLKWGKSNDDLFVKCMNRHQNNLQLVKVDTKKNKAEIVYEEKNNTYVEYDNHLTFLENDDLIFTSEKDGFNHLYCFDSKTNSTSSITSGNWTVTDFYGVNKETQKAYFQSTEESEIERQIFEIDFKGKNKKNLTESNGQHTAHFNSDYSLFIDDFTNAETPPVYSIVETKTSKKLYDIKDNEDLKNKLSNYSISKKEFLKIDLGNEEKLNAWILKPNNFDASKKYPVLLYQYSGPNSQMVKNSWLNSNDFWFQSLTQKGFIVACLDGRGTGFKGQKFKTLTQNQLGKLETQDQIAFAKYLGKQNYIDESRIGIFGWSYGGTTALNCILQGNDVFKTAVSVAPVTNWRYYDTVYTERFMTTPQENPSGYDDNSPIFHAEKLKGNLLLVHGTADDNVHLQNSIQMINALTLAGKQFDLAMYTDKNHGIYGGNTRLHLFTKMTSYLLEKL